MNFLSEEKNHVFAVKVESVVIGFALAYELMRFDGNGNMLYLHQIEVLPEFRNQGMGINLMSHRLEYCKERGFLKLFLISEKSNRSAMALYRDWWHHQV